MNTIVIVREHKDHSFCEPIVQIGNIVERPLQRLSEKEIKALPQQFRCYSCQRIFKREKIGGIERDQYLCERCYPWLDSWTVGVIIRFDIKHGFPVRYYGFSKSKHLPNKVDRDITGSRGEGWWKRNPDHNPDWEA